MTNEKRLAKQLEGMSLRQLAVVLQYVLQLIIEGGRNGTRGKRPNS
jgi:hypothetical protein